MIGIAIENDADKIIKYLIQHIKKSETHSSYKELKIRYAFLHSHDSFSEEVNPLDLALKLGKNKAARALIELSYIPTIIKKNQSSPSIPVRLEKEKEKDNKNNHNQVNKVDREESKSCCCIIS